MGRLRFAAQSGPAVSVCQWRACMRARAHARARLRTSSPLFFVPLLQQGILAKHGVELIGAKLEAINKAEDRDLFGQVRRQRPLKSGLNGKMLVKFWCRAGGHL